MTTSDGLNLMKGFPRNSTPVATSCGSNELDEDKTGLSTRTNGHMQYFPSSYPQLLCAEEEAGLRHTYRPKYPYSSDQQYIKNYLTQHDSSKLNPLLAIASHQWFDRLFNATPAYQPNKWLAWDRHSPIADHSNKEDSRPVKEFNQKIAQPDTPGIVDEVNYHFVPPPTSYKSNDAYTEAESPNTTPPLTSNYVNNCSSSIYGSMAYTSTPLAFHSSDVKPLETLVENDSFCNGNGRAMRMEDSHSDQTGQISSAQDDLNRQCSTNNYPPVCAPTGVMKSSNTYNNTPTKFPTVQDFPSRSGLESLLDRQPTPDGQPDYGRFFPPIQSLNCQDCFRESQKERTMGSGTTLRTCPPKSDDDSTCSPGNGAAFRGHTNCPGRADVNMFGSDSLQQEDKKIPSLQHPNIRNAPTNCGGTEADGRRGTNMFFGFHGLNPIETEWNDSQTNKFAQNVLDEWNRAPMDLVTSDPFQTVNGLPGISQGILSTFTSQYPTQQAASSEQPELGSHQTVYSNPYQAHMEPYGHGDGQMLGQQLAPGLSNPQPLGYPPILSCQTESAGMTTTPGMTTNFQANLNYHMLPPMGGLIQHPHVNPNGSYSRLRIPPASGLSQHLLGVANASFGHRSMVSLVQNPPVTETDYNPRELEAFSERFKQRRIKLGVTQADVGKALGNLKIAGVGSLSQSTICRFESLTLSHNNMVALKPVLQAWLEEAEAEAAERLQHPEIYDPEEERRRKRTSITDSEKRSLEAFFSVQPRPSSEKIAQIAEKLNLKKNVVRVWFCNQRQKQKRMKFSTLGLLHHPTNRV
ncbi:unnamed protein product [Calicophoron daubneyi]|uniref:POU domain protein n=1 Tax=Calicophoron daubneyi TaxID=300641 RepID=A0AAV2TIM7_CALDB